MPGLGLRSLNRLTILLKTGIQSLLLARLHRGWRGEFHKGSVLRGGDPAAWSLPLVENKTDIPRKRRLSESPHIARGSPGQKDTSTTLRRAPSVSTIQRLSPQSSELLITSPLEHMAPALKVSTVWLRVQDITLHKAE